MGEQTEIRWTNHTLNFWWGCLKVSPGCTNCYAETFSKRVGRNIWGPAQTTERWRTKGPWQDCLKWDKQAERDGVRRKVFCQSMSDFFEVHPQVTSWRWHALRILEEFTSLDVQLLTKRIENVTQMVPDSWLKNWPSHIWIGTSVENQEYADKRIPELLKIPAAVRFLSVEPLLGPVDLWPAKYPWPNNGPGLGSAFAWGQGVNWVIVGGESGPKARPMHPQWARDLRDQCVEAGVPYFFKQWGSWIPGSQLGDLPEEVKDKLYASKVSPQWMDRTGKFDPEFFPRDGFIPNAWEDGWDLMSNVGKEKAGHLLDGVEWSLFPDSKSMEV